MIVGIGEDTKCYRVYLPKEKIVVTTQHVKNVETLDKTQNEQVQRLYLRDDYAEAEEEGSSEDASSAEVGDAGNGEATSGRLKSAKRQGKKLKKKKTWTRERLVTRSEGPNIADGADEPAQKDEPGRQEESGQEVDNVIDVDPRSYR
ncbi:hypothetical protein PI124_g6982 [Phytophthora idaei]|nr:hypothetical protein PI125_g6639 [Phytophthora idaei]KAG3161549.1 hypothetical protein PI126_g6380 [Phytophthora idaei]KAG3248342.1 hypothetical protein PI124_g6982 [Phytophthora idaei]